MSKVLELQRLQANDAGINAEMAGSLASLGCDDEAEPVRN
jgi:hypothetical protein